ncbi:energy transducer TonB [Nevskia sp.]|uniref:energy transducer TonB n=1 Tax=Nevskia sp. TaxID=1929292 RepID=UPI0025E51484|nr:energy transducer TonB [Nevskia sp.]
MNYAEYPEPRKNIAGLTAVVGLHLVIAYALATGLAHKVVDVLKAPLTVSVIEEIKPLPPPPPPPPPPPKQVRVQTRTPPPPSYVPPAEVVVEAPTPVASITTSPEPVPEPPPAAPAVPVAAPIVNAAVACPNSDQVRSRVPYPTQAERLGLSGNVLVEFTVSADGTVRNVTAIKSSNVLFTNTATRAVSEFRCNGQGHDVRVRVPFAFNYS